MSTSPRQATRIEELRAIIDAYHQMTVEEAEESDAGDREVEAQAELWRLEQELRRPEPPHRHHKHAA
jgi:uncharacterized coiled-coil DUF342 family protein